MTYSVKEIFYTLQGEGAHSGRPAVFCRFSGCNLWSGREADRSTADCQFCDTDFVGTVGSNGGKYQTSDLLVEKIQSLWPEESRVTPFVVCTGGEPLLQLDDVLIQGLKARGFMIAIETNGTLPVPSGVDWVCVSPKGKNTVVVQEGDELKLVYPQAEVDPVDFLKWDFDHFFIQPMDGMTLSKNTELSIEYCKTNPRWKLSLQTHKIVNIE